MCGVVPAKNLQNPSSCFVSVFPLISGIDEQLARHYAHLFIRDPLTLFHEHIHEDDEQHTDHFEVQRKLGIAYNGIVLTETVVWVINGQCQIQFNFSLLDPDSEISSGQFRSSVHR